MKLSTVLFIIGIIGLCFGLPIFSSILLAGAYLGK